MPKDQEDEEERAPRHPANFVLRADCLMRDIENPSPEVN